LLAGVLLQAASRRVPVLFDGVVSAAAALIAQAVSPGAVRWWQPAQLTGDPGFELVNKALGLDPIVNFRMGTGDGSGGLIALGVLRAALTLGGGEKSEASAHV